MRGSEKFQSTHSVGVRPSKSAISSISSSVSIHALRGECDRQPTWMPTSPLRFNPRTPWGVRRASSSQWPLTSCFNPRTPWGVRRQRGLFCFFPMPGFNPRTPWGVRRNEPYALRTAPKPFQSTHSVGSATPDRIRAGRLRRCFNPRTPWGVRPAHPGRRKSHKRFQSTHSVGSATRSGTSRPAATRFQSTHSVGSATPEGWIDKMFRKVSIHALRGECDLPM